MYQKNVNAIKVYKKTCNLILEKASMIRMHARTAATCCQQNNLILKTEALPVMVSPKTCQCTGWPLIASPNYHALVVIADVWSISCAGACSWRGRPAAVVWIWRRSDSHRTASAPGMPLHAHVSHHICRCGAPFETGAAKPHHTRSNAPRILPNSWFCVRNRTHVPGAHRFVNEASLAEMLLRTALQLFVIQKNCFVWKYPKSSLL